MPDEPSREFLDAFLGVGSRSIACCCGRQHVAPGDEEHHPEACVYAKEVGGLTIVDGCECGTLAKLERIVWTARDGIRDYYRARQRRLEQQAAHENNANEDPQ